MARYRGIMIAWWALAMTLGPFASASAATRVTLQVEVSQGFPGLNRSALSRFIAVRMAEAGLANWRFEPAPGNGVAADQIEPVCRRRGAQLHSITEPRRLVWTLGDD